MNEKLSGQLSKKYINLFKYWDDRKGMYIIPDDINNFNYYIGVGDGWYDILDELLNVINIEMNKDIYVKENFIINDIKEKFGGLRFYISGGNDIIDKAIDIAEDKSYKTCEFCGKPGINMKLCGWYATECDTHHEQRKLKYKEMNKNND